MWCGQSRLGLLLLVLVRTLDQALHGVGGDGRAAAQVEVEVEQDGPECQQLGEHDRITRW